MKHKVLLIVCIITTFFLFADISDLSAKDRSYGGKVIDADTKEPIEGAVVVAVWRETRGTITGPDTRFKYAKETLTNKNGEWYIVGPEGYEDKIIPGLLHIIGVFVTKDPEFIIYKPGYKTRGFPDGFEAYPYVDKKHNLEGIVLRRTGNTWNEISEFSKKYGNELPFIPVKDPERKLRDLDFSFEYPENVRTVGWQRGIEPFKVYTVIGLKEAKTREERLEAMPSGIEGSQHILERLIVEERKYLGLSK